MFSTLIHQQVLQVLVFAKPVANWLHETDWWFIYLYGWPSFVQGLSNLGTCRVTTWSQLSYVRPVILLRTRAIPNATLLAICDIWRQRQHPQEETLGIGYALHFVLQSVSRVYPWGIHRIAFSLDAILFALSYYTRLLLTILRQGTLRRWWMN